MKKVGLTFLIVFQIGLLSAQNNCLEFSGADDYVTIGSNFGLGATTKSVECWVYLSSTSEKGTFVGIGNEGNGSGIGVGSANFDNPGNELIFINDVVSWHPTEVNIGTGWHHVAYTIGSAGETSIYLDGKSVLSFTETANAPSNTSFIGATSSLSRKLSYGKIDEVRFWNDVRTQDEIRQNMYVELNGAEDNLVAYYKLNEGTGTTVDNAQGNASYDGTLTNGGWQTSSALFGPKNCLNFNATNDYAVVNNITANILSNTLTIEFWVMFNSLTDQQNIAILSAYYVTSDKIVPYKNSSNQLILYLADYINNDFQISQVETSFTVNQGVWYHVACVYSQNKAYVFINGSLEGQNENTVDFAMPANEVLRLTMGSDVIGSYNADVRLDEVRIWNDVRTASEIRENMMKNLTGNEEGLVAYYNFDNSGGTTLQDFSGNDYDGTLMNMANDDWVGSSAFNTWLNTTNNSWRTTTNWSLGSYPTTGHNAGVYNYGGSSVQPYFDGNIECRNLVIGANSDITFSNPLDVDENFLVNSGFDIPDNCGMLVGKVIITSGKTLTVRPGGMIDIYNGIVNDGTFSIESNSTATGSVIVDGSYSGSGNYITQRYIAQWTDVNHGWHFLSSPVSDQAIQPGFVPNPPSVNEDFYSWDEPTDNWINSKTANYSWNSSFESTFTVGKGYLVAYGSNQTKVFSGTWNKSDVAISNLTHTISSEHSGWNLLGNPFPSGISWKWNIEWEPDWQQQNIGSTAKIWQESAASYTDIDHREVIPAMQGFMVYVVEGQTGSLIIPKNLRDHDTDTWYKNEDVNTLKLTVYDTEFQTAQETVIRFHPDADQGFEIAHDCWFLPGYAPQFYTKIEGKAASTNGLPELNEDMQIPVYFIKNGGTQFYIRVEGTDNLDPDLPLYLSDLQTQITQNLTTDPTYNFTAAPGDDPARFLLHFKSASGLSDENPDNAASIRLSACNNVLYMHNPEAKTGRLELINLIGQTIHSVNINGDIRQEFQIEVSPGYYLAKFSGDDLIISRKIYISH